MTLTDEVALYGRAGDRNHLIARNYGLTLVVGDSGIGKSSFLASLTTWPGEPLVSSPIVLKSVEGALQTALADAISDCMSQYLEGAQDAHTAWTVVKSIADQAKTITGREISGAILARALTFAETKLGKEVVEIGKRVLGDVAKGGMLGFDDRLASIRVPDRAKDLCEIAASLSEAVGRPVVLRLDNAERLAPSEHGLMAELVDTADRPVRIVACVTPHHEAGDAIIHQLSLRGVETHQLLPLGQPAIENWLISANVPPSRWDAIKQLSSGYPFFITEAIQLSGAGASFDELATPNGFQALLRASWKNITPAIRETAARLAPFVEPPSDDFLLNYLKFDILQWEILTDELLESGIFVRRSDGAAWFHDRRRAFIWEGVLNEKSRKHIAGEAFTAVATWVDGRNDFEVWVPPATAVLARAADPSATGSLTLDLLGLPAEGIALLWGMIEVIEPGSLRGPFAEIGEVLRHAEARSGLVIDALNVMTQLEAKGLIETREDGDARLVRTNVRQNSDYAALLGEVQLRFHSTPRPRLASAAFNAFIRPVVGPFDAAVITLGELSYLNHKSHANLLRDPQLAGSDADRLSLGSTVTIDGQQISFTAKFPTRETRDKAEQAIQSIPALTSRVHIDRIVPLPQPRVRYARYRLAVESLGLGLAETHAPTSHEIVEFFNLRARYAEAMGSVSTAAETEVLNLGLKRFLVDIRRAPSSWTSFEVLTDSVQPTRDVSELALDLHDPLLELRLRANGYLTGNERIVRTVTQFGEKLSTPHPLVAVLNDIEAAGKKYNAGLQSVLFSPDPNILEREIYRERQRISNVLSALEMTGLRKTSASQPSILVGFWEDADGALQSDYGSWSACALEVQDGQGVVAVRRFSGPFVNGAEWPDMTVPPEFTDHAGETADSWHSGDADAVIAPLVGYADRDARMMDLDSTVGQIIRDRHEIFGASEMASVAEQGPTTR